MKVTKNKYLNSFTIKHFFAPYKRKYSNLHDKFLDCENQDQHTSHDEGHDKSCPSSAQGKNVIVN